MNVATDTIGTTAKPAPVKPAWACLIIAWVLFVLPVPGVGLFIGWPLNLVAFILAIVIMARGYTGKGLIPLIASLVVSPIVYFIGIAILSAAAISASNDARQRAENVATESHA